MVSSLSDTLESGFFAVSIIENGTETPSSDQLEELDAVIARRFEWAFRFGMGASISLNDYRYGYIIGGRTINEETIGEIKAEVDSETTVSNPDVLLRPVHVPEDEFESMEQIGKLPHELLSSLSGLREEVEDNIDS